MVRELDLFDDGLMTAEIGRWSLEKYRLLALYDTLFAKGMRHRWDVRVYLDLFCGPGRARLRGTAHVIETSPLIALRVPDRFDTYIFCDENPQAIEALRRRVTREFPATDVTYLIGNCHDRIIDIVAAIPKGSTERTVLSLCFLDPYGISDIKFDTMWTLSRCRMDFLVLLALAMDANRFQALYVQEDNRTIDEFLGDRTWRTAWQAVRHRGVGFRRFLAERFAQHMTTLGYLPTGLETMLEVRSSEHNLPLYHLAFFSKHPRGYQFWKEACKYSTDQLTLFG
jgi:three-Cys-motif partner protein